MKYDAHMGPVRNLFGMLVDTNVWSDMRRSPSTNLKEWFKEMGRLRRYMAWCVYLELVTGGFASAHRQGPEIAAPHLAYAELCRRRGVFMPPSAQIIRESSRLRANPKLRNLWITHPNQKLPNSGADIDLAAASRVTGMPVATENVRHFAEIHRQAPLNGIWVPSRKEWHVPYRPDFRSSSAG